MTWTFESEIFAWDAKPNYHLLNLPEDVADDLDERVPHKAGFGSIKVSVEIGTSKWQTSVFPSAENKTYILPVKKAVLTKEKVGAGDTVTVTLAIAQ